MSMNRKTVTQELYKNIESYHEVVEKYKTFLEQTGTNMHDWNLHSNNMGYLIRGLNGEIEDMEVNELQSYVYKSNKHVSEMKAFAKYYLSTTQLTERYKKLEKTYLLNSEKATKPSADSFYEKWAKEAKVKMEAIIELLTKRKDTIIKELSVDIENHVFEKEGNK